MSEPGAFERVKVYVSPELYERGHWEWGDLADVVAEALRREKGSEQYANVAQHAIKAAKDETAARDAVKMWAEVYVGHGPEDARPLD